MADDALTEHVASGDVAAVRAALEAGADPNVLGGLAPLYLARDPAIIALLLQHGAQPDWQTENDETALTFAAHDGALDAVEILLAGGADPNLPSADWPPLFYAAMAGHLAVVEALADAGADLLREQRDSTALSIAVDHGHFDIARVLLARAPAIAGKGLLDPVGLARDRGQQTLAEQIEAQRWSAPHEGLRGRLRALPPSEQGGSYRVVFDLENIGTESRSVPVEEPLAWTWRLSCDGVDVPTALGRMDVLHRVGQIRIAAGERAEIAVSPRPGSVERAHPLDLVTVIWAELPPGRLHLHGVYRSQPHSGADIPSDARSISLHLPSCRLPDPP